MKNSAFKMTSPVLQTDESRSFSRCARSPLRSSTSLISSLVFGIISVIGGSGRYLYITKQPEFPPDFGSKLCIHNVFPVRRN